MSVYRVTEVIGVSEESREDAAREAASRSAAGSSWRYARTSGSPAKALNSACPRSCSASSPGWAAPSGCPG